MQVVVFRVHKSAWPVRPFQQDESDATRLIEEDGAMVQAHRIEHCEFALHVEEVIVRKLLTHKQPAQVIQCSCDNDGAYPLHVPESRLPHIPPECCAIQNHLCRLKK